MLLCKNFPPAFVFPPALNNPRVRQTGKQFLFMAGGADTFPQITVLFFKLKIFYQSVNNFFMNMFISFHFQTPLPRALRKIAPPEY